MTGKPVRIKSNETFKVSIKLERIVSATLDYPLAVMEIIRRDGTRERLVFEYTEFVATMGTLYRAYRVAKKKKCLREKPRA